MVRTLISTSSGLGSSSGRGNCDVLELLIADPLPPERLSPFSVLKGIGESYAGDNPAMD